MGGFFSDAPNRAGVSDCVISRIGTRISGREPSTWIFVEWGNAAVDRSLILHPSKSNLRLTADPPPGRTGTPGERYGSSTRTSDPSTFTVKLATFTDGFLTLVPVVTSYCQPCQGQVTTVSSTSPSPRGPPRWRHVLWSA